MPLAYTSNNMLKYETYKWVMVLSKWNVPILTVINKFDFSF